MHVQLVVFLLFTIELYTPHIILNTFEKRAMDVELEQNSKTTTNKTKWNDCWFVFEKKLRALCKQNNIHSNFSFLQKETKTNHKKPFFVKPFCSLCLCFCFFFVRIQLTTTRTASWERLLATQNASSVKGQKIKTVKVFAFTSLIIKTSPVRVWDWPFGEQFVGEGKIVCWLQSATYRMPLRKDGVKSECLPLLLNSIQAAIELLWVW